jgi:hypothetical protein
LRITHFSETTKDRNLIFGMGGDANETKNAIALTKIILKICTFSIKNHDFTRRKEYINLNFELALNNSVIMLPTKNYIDRPKTKSAIKIMGFF